MPVLPRTTRMLFIRHGTHRTPYSYRHASWQRPTLRTVRRSAHGPALYVTANPDTSFRGIGGPFHSDCSLTCAKATEECCPPDAGAGGCRDRRQHRKEWGRAGSWRRLRQGGPVHFRGDHSAAPRVQFQDGPSAARPTAIRSNRPRARLTRIPPMAGLVSSIEAEVRSTRLPMAGHK
jgi:hypothetical protein